MRTSHSAFRISHWPGLGRAHGAHRDGSESEAGSPPLAAPPLPGQEPGAPRPAPDGPAPRHQKLALWAGGALVVLIVLVIMLVSPRRPPLELVPKGQTMVQVWDVPRFLSSPLYKALVAANHPLLTAIESKEEKFGISLRRDVAVVIDTNDSTILVGRFRADRLRDGFEENIEVRERELNRGRAAPVELKLEQAKVEGHEFRYCKQEGIDHAFAAVGSSVVCFGDFWGVRRFLKGVAGVRGQALDDTAFAAAYSPELARQAILYRLEKPGGKLVASRLKEVLGEPGEGIQATFFAIAATRGDVEVAIRFAARDPKAAEKLETQLSKATIEVALRALLGADASVKVARADRLVALEATIPLDDFDEIVEKDKKGQGSNLILSLLAN